jgi:hypothetical protein
MMVRAEPARHGFAMMVALRPRHPGSARMIQAKIGRRVKHAGAFVDIMASP